MFRMANTAGEYHRGTGTSSRRWSRAHHRRLAGHVGPASARAAVACSERVDHGPYTTELCLVGEEPRNQASARPTRAAPGDENALPERDPFRAGFRATPLVAVPRGRLA